MNMKVVLCCESESVETFSTVTIIVIVIGIDIIGQL